MFVSGDVVAGLAARGTEKSGSATCILIPHQHSQPRRNRWVVSCNQLKTEYIRKRRFLWRGPGKAPIPHGRLCVMRDQENLFRGDGPNMQEDGEGLSRTVDKMRWPDRRFMNSSPGWRIRDDAKCSLRRLQGSGMSPGSLPWLAPGRRLERIISVAVSKGARPLSTFPGFGREVESALPRLRRRNNAIPAWTEGQASRMRIVAGASGGGTSNMATVRGIVCMRQDGRLGVCWFE